MKKLIFVLLLLSLVAHAEQCIYSEQCPGDLICQTDINGRGTCVDRSQAEAQGQTASGRVGEKCNFPSDCQDGLLCARPRGYLSYGVCSR